MSPRWRCVYKRFPVGTSTCPDRAVDFQLGFSSAAFRRLGDQAGVRRSHRSAPSRSAPSRSAPSPSLHSTWLPSMTAQNRIVIMVRALPRGGISCWPYRSIGRRGTPLAHASGQLARPLRHPGGRPSPAGLPRPRRSLLGLGPPTASVVGAPVRHADDSRRCGRRRRPVHATARAARVSRGSHPRRRGDRARCAPAGTTSW
jgi:hypothetical protein